MKAYIALIRNEVRLAFRQKVVIFFNYLMPLVFFFIFAQSLHAEQGGVILQIFTMVTVIGMLGNGLVGAGMRAVQERETNILRRYKVAPISPLPMLVASTVTGLVVYMPFVLLMLILARTRYGMPAPAHLAQVMLFIALGVASVRSICLILSSVVNTMAEAQILVQIVYMAMLFLSGTTFPTTSFPPWLMTATQFIPSTYLVSGLQGLMIRNETLADNWQSTGALLLTVVIGLLLAVKLFRWEKEEKIRPSGKLWFLVILIPFIALGTWQTYAKENVTKAKLLERDLSRSRSRLIRNARIFTGDGRVIETGSVLIRDGHIAEIYDGEAPDAKLLKADEVEGAGKTILPGLIDTHIHLSLPIPKEDAMVRSMAAYLYCGVTAVRSVGDNPELAGKVRTLIDTAEKEGPDLFLTLAPPGESMSLDESRAANPAKVAELSSRSLVQQVTPHDQFALLRRPAPGTPVGYKPGAPLVAGSEAGRGLIFHGPSIQHELALWIEAGIPPVEALKAATLNAAKALGQDSHFGSITKGKDATLLVVNGNPLQDIHALESISLVMLKGEVIDRPGLLKAEAQKRSRGMR